MVLTGEMIDDLIAVRKQLLASAALRKKSDSLLPEGVMDVVGEFEPGDVVELRDRVGRVLGRGLANYRSSDCVQLVGKSVADIGPTLGWRGCVAKKFARGCCARAG